MNTVQYGGLAMNKSFISKEIIMEESKKIMRESGPELLSIREIARRCQISVGSVYNYYSSKEDLIADTLESIWTEIMHGEKNILKAESFIESVTLLYEKICNGSAKYPLFLSVHSHYLDKLESFEGKSIMGKYEKHIIAGLARSLKNDSRIREDAFKEILSVEDFSAFVFSNVLQIAGEGYISFRVLLEVIKRAIY